MSRFDAFNNFELALLWDSLTMDDGIRYGFDGDQALERSLASELHETATKRGIAPRDPDRWGDVL